MRTFVGSSICSKFNRISIVIINHHSRIAEHICIPSTGYYYKIDDFFQSFCCVRKCEFSCGKIHKFIKSASRCERKQMSDLPKR